MNETEQTNKIKILEELQKNGRASASEIAEKTGLSRQTVTKIIRNMEKKKEIWGYTAIFNPELIGKKPFIIMTKLDLSINPEEFIKKVINEKSIKLNEEKGMKISMFLHGTSDLLCLFWVKDIVEAKKTMNFYLSVLRPNIKEIELFDVMKTFRFAGIVHPNMKEEWTSLII
ncbi:MAG: winged helix-turn-helix transcriptional regulator [Candidatus Thermoplasmatota archaeon]|nr:winged helix-turn-helix transcriptional regulator [Candidatus Thermoplasmatota archaeon]